MRLLIGLRVLTAFLGVAAIAILSSTRAEAIPMLAVDVDPGTPGVQSFAQISLGGTLQIDLVIQDVEAAAPLNAFELDVVFDPTGLAGVGVSLGTFLTAPTLAIEETATASSLLLAATTIGSAAASGNGILGTGEIDTLAIGTFLIDLDNVILAQPFGVPIGSFDLSGASVQVVPEPSTILLVAFGLAILARINSDSCNNVCRVTSAIAR